MATTQNRSVYILSQKITTNQYLDFPNQVFFALALLDIDSIEKFPWVLRNYFV
jgi:hypothetical protein